VRAIRVAALVLVVTVLAVPAPGLEARAGDADPAPSPGAEAGPEVRPYWRQNLFRRIWFDQRPLVVSWWPAELARPNFSGPLAATTVVALTSDWGDTGGVDVRLERWLHDACGTGCTNASDALTTLGNWPVLAAGMGIAWWAGARAGNERLAEASSLGLEALATSGLWNEALKQLTARARPPGGSLGSFWNYGGAPPGQEVGSFPSGHAQIAFTVAAVYATAYREKPWVAWLAYGAASAISLGRVALGRHFPTDVIVGGMLGASIGRFTVARARGEPNAGRALRAAQAWRPDVDPGRGVYALYWVRTW
jgi:membrane-associated phospholipid phosphatase